MRYPSPVAGSRHSLHHRPVGGSLQSPPAFAEADRSARGLPTAPLDRVRLHRDPWLRRPTLSQLRPGIAPYVKDFLAGTPSAL